MPLRPLYGVLLLSLDVFGYHHHCTSTERSTIFHSLLTFVSAVGSAPSWSLPLPQRIPTVIVHVHGLAAGYALVARIDERTIQRRLHWGNTTLFYFMVYIQRWRRFIFRVYTLVRIKFNWVVPMLQDCGVSRVNQPLLENGSSSLVSFRSYSTLHLH
ncbi:hypothetical protein EDC04DRAFT_2743748 [Pisolithus marmoratus]|nr:hypothetical protein EDC04DRAFT_2743748 [Pisolithus marmoratus]